MCYNGYMNLPVHPANADAHNIIYSSRRPAAKLGQIALHCYLLTTTPPMLSLIQSSSQIE